MERRPRGSSAASDSNTKLRTRSSLRQEVERTWSLSQLQAAHVLRQAVGFGTGHGGAGGDGARRPLPRHLHRGPQQVDLLTVDVLHVVLRDRRGERDT